MVVFPGVKAVTNPVTGFTVAIASIVLLHIPPASPVDVKLLVAPMHSGLDPIIVPAFAFGFTVNAWKEDTGALQPVLTV